MEASSITQGDVMLYIAVAVLTFLSLLTTLVIIRLMKDDKELKPSPTPSDGASAQGAEKERDEKLEQVPTTSDIEVPIGEENTPKKIVCEECGTENNSKFTFCENCVSEL